MADTKSTLEDIIIKQVEQLAGEHFPGTDDTAATMRKVWVKRFFNNLAVGNAHPEFFPDENYPAGAPRRTQHFIAWDLPRLMIEWTALSRHLFNTSAQDCAKKVVHEAKELLKESQTPWIYDGDREHGIIEMVDVMMALLSTMDRSNVSLDEFTAAFKTKMEINRNREWIQNQDGTYSHKKEDPDDDYPGKQYQRLFDAMSNITAPPVQSEMDDIIKIVRDDFPATSQERNSVTVNNWLTAIIRGSGSQTLISKAARELKHHFFTPKQKDRCTNCGQLLDPDKVVMLELSNTSGSYYKDGVPDGHKSQGWFPFGEHCAETILNSQF